MKNPTREEVKQIKTRAEVFSGACREQEVIWLCDFALRALDMRDTLYEWSAGSHASFECRTVREIVEKFDGGEMKNPQGNSPLTNVLLFLVMALIFVAGLIVTCF